ncbi:MAG: hypothetical protein HYY04_04810 [Chloroflexi bacterium]|nr:hypothetical protein [Chloroflexota bacterium]
MLSFLRRNLAWMLLAVLLSTGLWLAVVLEQNPEVPVSFASVPIQVKGIPTGLALANEIPTTRIWLIAPQDVGPQLRPDRLRVEIDASKAGPGIQEVPVTVAVLDSRARLDRAEPSTVPLRLEAIRKKEVPVRVNLAGSVAFGFAARPPRVTPPTVTVHGPQGAVDQVAAVVVSTSLEGLRSSLSQGFAPVPATTAGTPVERVTLDPERVLVEVAVEQQVSYKTVPIAPQVAGTVAYGYQIVGILVEPTAVTVVGDPAVLMGMEYLQTRPVVVNGAEGDVAVSAEPALPPGVSLAVAQSMLVRVLVRPIESSKTMLIAPEVRGLSDQLTARVEPDGVQVTLSGPLPLLAQIRPEDVQVMVNATGLMTGTHTLRPAIGLPNLIKLVGMNPKEVRMTVR